jgi:hypothetical protein
MVRMAHIQFGLVNVEVVPGGTAGTLLPASVTAALWRPTLSR